VATVANAGGYTSAALNIVGAIAVYIDVDPGSHLMDLEQLKRVVGAGEIDAIVVTHLFGRMLDLARLRGLADRAGIPLIEDCAQAHGARRGGQRAGSVGDVACFSFYPTKNLGALGDAGAVTTNSPELAARTRVLRQYGWGAKYRVTEAGGRNSRLDELQAAVLRAKLPHLDGWNARRREIAARYTASIDNPRIKCPPIQGDDYVAHLYVIECDDRDGLREHLAASQIVCDIHYPTPDHVQPVALRSGGRCSLPVTERLAGRVLTLPCFSELEDREVDRIVDLIKAWR
jgi:dTDP-4-amino-4,6-dideoxygalactose transaminase